MVFITQNYRNWKASGHVLWLYPTCNYDWSTLFPPPPTPTRTHPPTHTYTHVHHQQPSTGTT